MKRGALKRTTPLRRRRAARRRPAQRDWIGPLSKVFREGHCRGCGLQPSALAANGRRLEAAHILGRAFDRNRADGVRVVDPDSVVPLCGPPTTTGTCHERYDAHALDLWDRLTEDERAWAVERVGQGQALRRIRGRGKA